MIERVLVEGYKSLRRAEIRLSPLAVILGPNAAGKTNLFDALGLLARIVTGKTMKDAFDPAVHRGVPLEAFYCGDGASLSAQARELSIQVDVRLSDPVVEAVEQQIADMTKGLPDRPEAKRRRVLERRLRYRIEIEMMVESGYLRVRDERLVALNEDGSERQTRRPFLERIGDRLSLRMEGQGRPTEHRIGLDYAIVSAPLYPPHYPHIAAFKEELARWRFYYLEPSGMREEVPLQELRSIGPSGRGLAAFFNTLKVDDPRQFDALRKAVRTLVPPIEALDVKRTPHGFLQLSVVEGGTEFSSRVISEGTIRILGLLAITNPVSPVTVIGYEEPENGIHAQRLPLIARLFENAVRSGKQILVNTHSPVLAEQVLLATPDATLTFCKRIGNDTTFEDYVGGPLFVSEEAAKAMSEVGPEGLATTLSERAARGDFGA